MQEKYNIDIVFNKNSDLKKEDMGNGFIEEAKKKLRTGVIKDVEMFEKTDKEKELVEKANRVVLEFFKDHNQRGMVVPLENIHITSPDKKGELESDMYKDAYFSEGHIYIPRTDDEIKFIYLLTHEMAHDLSYRVNEINIEESENTAYINSKEKRTGYSIETKHIGNIGDGFNEAMTELIASEFRERYAEMENLSEEKKQRLEQVSYGAEVSVLMGAIKALNKDHEEEINYDFIDGYLFGSTKALKNISKRFIQTGRSNGLKILFQMDAKIESALETATKLDLKDVRKEIEKMIAGKYPKN